MKSRNFARYADSYYNEAVSLIPDYEYDGIKYSFCEYEIYDIKKDIRKL